MSSPVISVKTQTILGSGRSKYLVFRMFGRSNHWVAMSRWDSIKFACRVLWNALSW